ncbi:hypothetical protein [Vallitalea guaymasensis]|uniref:hypothetical protein n=1 Tax=Vallitalea guaymasensis TaxID=1185412 RepID=UPI0023558834|nr:hypothetical protein [Vallitalea guaymasensis]
MIRQIDLPIDMGTKFLTNECAYFLAGILIGNETININSTTYWTASVRHNSSYITNDELEKHYSLVRVNAHKIGKKDATLMKDVFSKNGIDFPKFKRMKGFATLFKENQQTSVEELIELIKQPLLSSTQDVMRAFIVGLVDGRGAIDLNKKNNTIRYISIDCNNDKVASFCNDILISQMFDVNYNRSRDRLEGGRPRENQLRIRNSKKFIEKYGLLSPKKFDVFSNVYLNDINTIISCDNILKGLKIIN